VEKEIRERTNGTIELSESSGWGKEKIVAIFCFHLLFHYKATWLNPWILNQVQDDAVGILDILRLYS